MTHHHEHKGHVDRRQNMGPWSKMAPVWGLPNQALTCLGARGRSIVWCRFGEVAVGREQLNNAPVGSYKVT